MSYCVKIIKNDEKIEGWNRSRNLKIFRENDDELEMKIKP